MDRRQFAGLLSALVGIPMLSTRLGRQSDKELAPEGSIADIPGLKVGHFTDPRRPTGCTVILSEAGAVAGVDVRGSAPGTRETDLLNPVNTVQKVHAILLSGGSAFGLDAVAGVVQYLEERGVGFKLGAARVPIVPAAVLFDLGVGDWKIRPDKAAGYAACRNAVPGSVQEGNVGAGAGATVGKMLGFGRSMKAGIGTASFRVGKLIVAALTAVNSAGDIIDPRTGKIVAGARTADGKTFANTIEFLKRSTTSPVAKEAQNTALGVIATNAVFDKAGMTKIAQMGHDGLARAINPAHTTLDGDTLFSISTGELEGAGLTQVGALAAEAVARATVRAARQAVGIAGIPAARDLGR